MEDFDKYFDYVVDENTFNPIFINKRTGEKIKFTRIQLAHYNNGLLENMLQKEIQDFRESKINERKLKLKEIMSEKIKIKVKKLDENASIPTKGSDLAGGWDVIATKIEDKGNGHYYCHLGFALEFPEGYRLTLVPRSSITKTRLVMQNSPGLGDADYIHGYQFRFLMIPNSDGTLDEFPYEVGDRIGQVYLEKEVPVEWELVDEIDYKNRDGGFGSTGK